MKAHGDHSVNGGYGHTPIPTPPPQPQPAPQQPKGDSK